MYSYQYELYIELKEINGDQKVFTIDKMAVSFVRGGGGGILVTEVLCVERKWRMLPVPANSVPWVFCDPKHTSLPQGHITVFWLHVCSGEEKHVYFEIVLSML